MWDLWNVQYKLCKLQLVNADLLVMWGNFTIPVKLCNEKTQIGKKNTGSVGRMSHADNNEQGDT